jgi:hypothetical protein
VARCRDIQQIPDTDESPGNDEEEEARADESAQQASYSAFW